MADQRVKQINTPISEAEMANALIVATKELYGITLSKSQTAILIAQNNLETNHRKAMHNYNIGNITHVAGDGWDYFMGGDKTKDKNGNWVPTTLKFRSYPNLNVAAKDYIKNIHNRGGGKSWQQIINADVAGFSKALKDSRYYEADEKAYTSALLGGANAFNKKDSYEQAKAGTYEKSTAIATNVPHDGSAMQSTHSSEVLVPGSTKSNALPDNKVGMLDKINSFLDKFLSSVAELEGNKLLKTSDYKKLPQHAFLINISSNDNINSLEFARILCAVLDEDAQAHTTVYTNKKAVDVVCKINGPKDICFAAVNQLCGALSDTFKIATKKIGGVKVNTSIIPNKKSSYQELDIKLAQSAYRQFHLKFIK